MTRKAAQPSSQDILASIREVEREASGGLEALFMAAMLAPAPLPYAFALSVEGAPHNPSLINPAASFFAATAMLDPLVVRGLIDIDPDQQTYGVPPLVRETLLASLDDETRLEWAGRAVYGLNLTLPDAEAEHWPTVEWLMPHVLACRDLVVTLGLHTPAANRVLHQAGFSLHLQGRHRQGADLLDIALAVDVALKGKHHPDIAADLEGLGVVLWAAGDLGRAETAFAGCLELQQAIFTKDNLVTAPILNGLGVVRQAQGKFDQAEAAFLECLRVLTRAHGEGHPSIASCLGNLALLHEAMGCPADALRLAERSLTINRAAFGDAHPEVASDLNTVALLCDALGDLAAAEANFRESLAVRQRAFGPDHPETAQSLCNLALFLDKAGRPDEAVGFYEQGLAAYEAALGPGHPLMESALDHYLVLLEKTGGRPGTDRLRALAEATLRRIVDRAR
ncbi:MULTISPECIES: tetratricopeptide repeat protein [Pseudodesulfovibrio]|uniref:Tetratricopeptide TPR_1 repeat-containing protein n=1 Tax=Pseudodesulfovibrio aespoeensis (strain ATCC 700646 / DSM 10631 / Aspo-2) TaxID=643562 RepID=E6VWH7_PSEA9|nr:MULTISPECIES: tetratricopeptide repeat protein [Pseudodesulfovibrio]ADU61383.1 Tetratricopeptide TPR_1 repeat-containing protein [Pseudodesulfovibrio aespoeensis Aspo-2]MCG2734266.1 tetratricopeptide repeat protein [Pseudodesulfovibrio aespoeensis]